MKADRYDKVSKFQGGGGWGLPPLGFFLLPKGQGAGMGSRNSSPARRDYPPPLHPPLPFPYNPGDCVQPVSFLGASQQPQYPIFPRRPSFDKGVCMGLSLGINYILQLFLAV